MHRHAGQLCSKQNGEHARCFAKWVLRLEKSIGLAKQPAQLAAAMDRKVKEAFSASKVRNDARRIQVDLEAQGDRHDVKTINHSMRRQDLVPKAARKFKVTTNSNHTLPVAPNLLNQDFEAAAPNQKWAGDITYLMTSEGWLYLAVMIDLHPRAVVGWSMGTRMTADLVCEALKMALWRRSFPEQTIIHSDRGRQYCSGVYRDLISRYKLRQSMAVKATAGTIPAWRASFIH
ncbi:MAG: IS3 family transposase [Motiliproteus sp.]|nr:IS3 family transposase [Motiliproteus sp.]MCW9051613.1 IS3 family transposase [Motiliproteus sp.]